VLTGAGRAFSAGGELRMAQASHDDGALRRVSMEEAKRTVLEMAGFPKPIVAAVNGPAVGLGFSLAVLCDIVFMADDAFFADPHLAVGLVAGDGAAMVLPFVTSLMHAKELLWTGDRIPAARAVQLGIANRVVARDDVLSESLAFASRLAEVPAQALQDTKRTMNLPLRQALVASLEVGIVSERESVASAEHAELIAAMIARTGRH
jgi:enoyl-CoA hydratase